VKRETWEARMTTRPDGTSSLSEYVFHCDGEQVGDFRKAWSSACRLAGFPALRFHDLRRSAARNLDKAGVSQTVGMQITGHETPSMYRRYRIVDEQDIELALVKTQEYIDRQSAAAPKISSLGSKSR
jgi:integrase